MLIGMLAPVADAETAVLTRSYDNTRTGANTAETTLSPAKILSRGLVKRFSLTLAGDDPRIEAQPLYVPRVMMKDNKRHNVLYVFSMTNKIWAFDADTGPSLWSPPVSLGQPFRPDLGDPVDIHNINRAFGILSTPVIDLSSETMYAVNWTLDSSGDRLLQLHALALRDGQPRKSPLRIEASVVNTAGQTVALSQVQKQRAALLLVPLKTSPHASGHKILYVAFTGQDAPPVDVDPSKAHHGWVVAFDVTDW